MKDNSGEDRPGGHGGGARKRASRSLSSWMGFGLGSVWSVALGLARLAILTIFVMALVGFISYRVMLNYVQGKTVNAPLLVGKELDEALVLLDDNGLAMELEKEEFTDKDPSGIVLNQYPPPDTAVKVGSPVRIVLSAGPAFVITPDVRGRSLKEAEIQLEQADLRRGARAAMESLSVREGSVISSDPPPGGRARRGQEVNLLVSTGPPRAEISAPTLLGKSVKEAESLAARLGLSLTWQAADGAAINENGVVTRQMPQPGSRISQNTSMLVMVR